MKKEKVLRALLILWGVCSILHAAYDFLDICYLLKRFTLFVGSGPYLQLWTALVSFALAWIIGRLGEWETPRQEELPPDETDPR